MYLAKTKPEQETIREHTDRLLTELKRLKEAYGSKIQGVGSSFWELLELAVRFHDAGKANVLFQNKLRKVLGYDLLPTTLREDEEIPHNYVSVAMLPIRQLNLSADEIDLLVEAIGFHHERNTAPETEKLFLYVEACGLLEQLEDIYNHLGLNYQPEKVSKRLLRRLERNRKDVTDKKIRFDASYRKKHVLLKGLLHRLDHAASAHVEVESGIEESPGDKTLAFMRRSFSQDGDIQLRPAQQFAWENSDKNVIITASTGSGKTEAALLWMAHDKGFFTLPLRVSLNAMYDRLKEKIELQHVGLLHSGSFEYLLEHDYSEGERTYVHSQQLAQKLTLTTIDQILKFPFLYKGFEKEYATLAYSKVVIDEIQAYDPHIAAMLIKALEMVVEIGGKFLVMTATLPRIYLQTLKERGRINTEDLAVGTFPRDDLLRHRIELRKSSIFGLLDEIVEKGKRAKVLVIVNTVDQAIAVYRELAEKLPIEFPLHLLHARFSAEDKAALEKEITQFAPSGWHKIPEKTHLTGIWVTTQIVEASLDVDFDYLFSEMCPLDSLFQRMGRCYRVRDYSSEEPNIIVATQECSGVGKSDRTVYDQTLVELSIEDLIPFNGQLIKESDKINLVDQLYSRERLSKVNSPFLQKFKESLNYFDTLPCFELKSGEAQEKLRDIRTTLVIPEKWMPTLKELIMEFEQESDRFRRRELRRKIEAKAISVRENTIRNLKMTLVPFNTPGLEYLSWILTSDAEYSFDPKTMKGHGLVFRRETHIL